jgi:hypothetical protein
VSEATFLTLCQDAGITLTAGQRELAQVAFDGGLPSGDLVHLGDMVYGSTLLPSTARRVVVVVAGRASGKSLLLGIRGLHLALTVDLSGLARREIATVPVVAPDLRTARVTVRYALGAAETVLGRKVLTDVNADGFSIRRATHLVRIEALAASAGGKSVRGRSMPAAIMDECAFFRDSSHIVNDAEIFAALMPRIMPGGQLLVGSTPWTESGLLYELWRDNYREPKTALVAHAPTLVMRDDADTAAMVAAERARDETNARREYDAEFLPRDASAFFDSRAIAACVGDYPLPVPKRYGPEYYVGADFGFARDSSALVVLEREADVFTVCDLLEVIPRDAPLVPSSVVAGFAAVVRQFGAEGVIADAHYRESIREHLDTSGLVLMSAPEGATGKAESYALARSLIAQGRVRLPKHERLLQQLRDVTVRPTSGGALSIQSPRWAGGGHGDLVSALVLAMWQAHRNYVAPEPEPNDGMDELERAEVEAMKRAAEERDRFGLRWLG